ncbi:hypothetical protein [Pseudomonas canadensis]|uniref:hypothetical protein n=1 Tax=Pseudomonas canadensis TaxID=915099 RepID=UPI003BA07314
MSTYEMDAVLDLTASILLQELHKAHWRYLNVAGMDSVIIPRQMAAYGEDYPPPVKRFTGFVVKDVEDCVTFMAEVTSFPPSFCEAWMKYDYYDESKHEI